jgi:mRNA interferase MazF
MVKNIFPKRRDIVKIDFGPTLGHEQGGVRPAIVLSNSKYNESTGLMVVCPITRQKKNYFFEVDIETSKTNGVIIVNHLKNVDWRCRKIKIIECVPETIMKEINSKLLFLLSD